MKIIGGTLKGRNFFMPATIRPTQNIVRKSLFDILGQDLTGIHFVEFCAGSGAMSFEAHSRGATRVVMVEKEPKCLETIRENMALLGITAGVGPHAACQVLEGDSFATIKLLSSRNERFDVVFIDPPYGRDLAKKALKTLEAHDIVHPTCNVIIQHEKREILPEQHGRFLLFRRKKYGTTVLSFYRISDMDRGVMAVMPTAEDA